MKTKKYVGALLALTLVFGACSKDDDPKQEAVVSFEGQLTEPNTEFVVDGATSQAQETHFKDPHNLMTFDHYYASYGQYSYSGFTYSNQTTHIYNGQPNSGTAKTGSVYIGVYSDPNFSPAVCTINHPDKYAIKGAWISNSKQAYLDMTQGAGGEFGATAFKKGSWYKVTATGYDGPDGTGNQIGEAVIALADYKSDTDLPVDGWIWFDLTPIAHATSILFMPSSSDANPDPYIGMNTSRYFCLDDITLVEK
ncbi:MAG: DUF4465 domain-containing protein [Mediterranea sp.]|jgi:hypothetical protein|nr:DUF4465 domain-containing protein [Mediterranea sp.]